MLRLRTFGGLSIENAGSIGGATANRRSLALLALLAANGGRGVSRDAIIALLWPESNSERGRNSLSQVISVLRRELGADDLVLGMAELRVNTDILACDVIEFEQHIAADDLESATRLYTGPFLDGVFFKNTPDFERWVDHERSRLQHAQADALEQLATRATARRDDVSAVRVWRQRASLEPTDSRAAHALMESLVASGDSAGALAHYRVHQALLRDDLALEPSAALVEFEASIRRGISHPAQPPADAPRSVNDPVPLAEQRILVPAAPASAVMRWRRVLLPVAAATVLVVGAKATWGAKNGRFGSGPPKPPAHDSLRLRIVTTVQSDPADSTLARGVRSTALAEMAKDPWLFVVTPEALVLQAPFIGLDAAALARPDTIRKYARKMRTHAIIDFSVSRAANGYVITAEARSASTDSSLGVIAEAAEGAADLPAAMIRLGRALRERLVATRSTLPPTIWSLRSADEPPQAVELYLEGRSEWDRRNWIESARRAGGAVGVDSTFAHAWMLRYSALTNASLSVEDRLHAISAAFRFRGRVRSPYYRLGIAGAYFRAIGDPERALVYYDSITLLVPRTGDGDKGLAYGALRRHEFATRGYRRSIDTTYKYVGVFNSNLVRSLLEEGKVDTAKREVAALNRANPTNGATLQSRNLLFTALRDWDSLSALGKVQLGAARTPSDSAVGVQWQRNAAIVRGQFAAFDSLARLNATILEEYASSGDDLAAQLQRAQFRATIAGDSARARAIADSCLAIARWESLRPLDRPYLALLLYLASVGDVQRGADVAREWSRSTPAEFKLRDSLNVLVGRGELALASGKSREALRLFRIADIRDCKTCFFPRYARAFDALNERDSARVWFELYAGASAPHNALGDAVELAHTYLRLGELYEERRDISAAVTWYGRFITLWATSDTPVLRAKVREIRGRVDRLKKQGH